MTPLRQRFIEDLQLRNRSPRTIQAYVFHVRNFARFHGRSPDQLDAEHAHRYLLHLLHEKKASWPQYNQAVSALRFLFTVKDDIRVIHCAKKRGKGESDVKHHGNLS